MKKKDTSYSNFALRLLMICTVLILVSTIIYSFNKYLSSEKKNKKENITENSEETKLVNKLYDYVTYGRDFQPMYYFYKNKELTNETFDNFEKFIYAFQLADKNNIIDLNERGFIINGNTYKGWVETIFGKGSEFDNSKVITLYTNDVLKNSIVNVEYNKQTAQYRVTKQDGFIIEEKENIKKFYAKLDDYEIDDVNKTISIKEKFIFVAKEVGNDSKIINSIKIYKDIYQSKLIDEIKNPSAKVISEFGINDYLKDANTITYTFKMDDEGNYYFYNSKVEE